MKKYLAILSIMSFSSLAFAEGVEVMCKLSIEDSKFFITKVLNEGDAPRGQVNLSVIEGKKNSSDKSLDKDFVRYEFIKEGNKISANFESSSGTHYPFNLFGDRHRATGSLYVDGKTVDIVCETSKELIYTNRFKKLQNK